MTTDPTRTPALDLGDLQWLARLVSWAIQSGPQLRTWITDFTPTTADLVVTAHTEADLALRAQACDAIAQEIRDQHGQDWVAILPWLDTLAAPYNPAVFWDIPLKALVDSQIAEDHAPAALARFSPGQLLLLAQLEDDDRDDLLEIIARRHPPATWIHFELLRRFQDRD